MKPKRQRLHSAELRRLDHIAQSLDRIAAALEKQPGIVVSGNDDTIIDTMDIKAGEKTQIALHTISNGTDIEHSQNVLLNSSGNDISMQAQRGGKNNRLASHDINEIQNGNGVMQFAGNDANNVEQSGEGSAAFGNVSGDTITVHGNGQIQHRINDSYNTNADETIKNLTSILK